MLETIPNSSMYTTIPPELEECGYEDYDEIDCSYIDELEAFIEQGKRFIEEEETIFKEIIKHEPL